ncbi:Kinesin-like protein [Quillaja saponaria]|uniref:Kinesin-like protein n=1 Tax=Quillaja saponaria TaxID=32244 RepID=A0AAD7QAZ7_QUISA|nr:Kinesin-like protein [Quillaja saponaria]
MDEPTMEILTEKFNRFVLNCISKVSSTPDPVQTLESAANDSTTTKDTDSEQVDGNPDCMDGNCLSNGIHEVSPDQGHTLPILQKIIDLSTKIQDLKKEHTLLSEQVKVNTDSFPGHDVLNSLQLLSAEHELLKKKYLEESLERKRLYNEVIELKGNIRVFCRCRPLNQNEIASGTASVIDFESPLCKDLQVICSDSSKKQFKFDHVFRPEDNQEAVFAQTKPIVTSVLDGYNVCIFAYGQTGTGKTFTMEGTPQQRGVNYRTLEELFRISEEKDGIIRYELFVSMLEVYTEKIRDLLADNSNQPTKKLEIKQAAEGTQEVPGLVEARVYNTNDVWELLRSGSRVRSVGSTSANELSSRSHCLLRVTVKGQNLINGQRTRSHLWLVDLAGSERVGRTEVEDRNSKLTHILQSSLGGDCKTLMFVQISPSAADLGETICSLNFASRVRGIESGPARKQADLTELFKYKQMAEKLKHDEKETKKLQDNLQSLQLRLAAREHICKNLQEKVRDLENHLAEERKTRLKHETRSVAAASAQSSAGLSLKQAADQKKPPLGPSKLRMPLRRITNFLPSPVPPKKRGNMNSFKRYSDRKENIPKATAMTTNREGFTKPQRRISIAVRPPPPSTAQVLQPRRRVSIATIRPDSISHMTTPLRTSASQFGNGCSAVGRQSLVRDPRRARYSKLFSPLPEHRTASETTPIAMRSSSKFMGSPLQAGSWKAKHQTVLAVQRKPLVWSPLKLRGLKINRRPSLLSSRPSTEMQ